MHDAREFSLSKEGLDRALKRLEDVLKLLRRGVLALEQAAEEQIWLDGDGTLEGAEVAVDQESDPAAVLSRERDGLVARELRVCLEVAPPRKVVLFLVIPTFKAHSDRGLRTSKWIDALLSRFTNLTLLGVPGNEDRREVVEV